MSDTNFSLEGTVVRDPEVKFANNGKCILNFSVAVNRKKGDDEYVSYFDCTAFGVQAENAGASISKGSRVVVFGTLTQDRWGEGETKRSAVKLLVDSVGISLRFGTVVYTKAEQRGAAARPATGTPSFSDDPF